jgi:hypothetical protein
MTRPTATPGIWRRLLESANAAVERPADRALAADFKHCALIAFSRGDLPDPADRDLCKPFNALTGFGKAWNAMATGERRANADAVLAAVEACEAQLGFRAEPPPQAAGPPEPAPEPAWKSRADIGG